MHLADVRLKINQKQAYFCAHRCLCSFVIRLGVCLQRKQFNAFHLTSRVLSQRAGFYSVPRSGPVAFRDSPDTSTAPVPLFVRKYNTGAHRTGAARAAVLAAGDISSPANLLTLRERSSKFIVTKPVDTVVIVVLKPPVRT